MKHYRAFIVEDDEDLAFIFAESLSSAGFEIEIIPNAGRALARLTEVVPHLVVLDMHLPKLSGMNVLRQIHAEHRLLNTRVIVATADAVLAAEISNKADLVLLKPVDFTVLRDLALRLVSGMPTYGAGISSAGAENLSAENTQGSDGEHTGNGVTGNNPS